MESFWSGAFSPTFKKTIATATFIPLEDMSEKDWLTLDYFNLRNVARNRISDLVVEGEIVGFFRVDILEKARHTKPRYFWPATQAMYIRFKNNDDGDEDAPKFFRNKSDVEFINENSEYILDKIGTYSSTLFWPTAKLMALIAIAREENNDEKTDNKLKEIAKEISTKRNQVSLYNWLLLLIYLLRFFGQDKLETLEDKIVNE